MQNWLPYLQEILGQDAHGQRQAEELITLAEALHDQRLQIMDRVRLLDWLSTLDSARQFFLLPWLIELLAIPSLTLRRRLLLMMDELQSGAHTSLIEHFKELIEMESSAKRDDATKTLWECLKELSEIFLEDTDFDQRQHFSSLRLLRDSRLKVPAFGLVTLLGISHWLESLPESKPLTTELKKTFANFFQDDEQASLLKQFDLWLNRGPLFLRYLILQWLGRTGIGLDSNVSETLYRCYCHDSDPLISGAAIEAFAQRVETDNLSLAIKKLVNEYSSFRERSLGPQNKPTTESVRIVSLSLLKALGHLAVAHYPAPEPVDELRKIINIRHQNHLDLSRSDLSLENKRKIFCASVLLHGSDLRIKIGLKRGALRGLVSSPRERLELALQDPLDVLDKHTRSWDFWVFPVPNEQFPYEPLRWNYQVDTPVPKKYFSTGDLCALNSPLFSNFPTGKNFSWKIQNNLEKQIDQRGWWMSVACKVTSQIILTGFQHNDSLTSEPLSFFFSYLVDMAIGAEFCRPKEEFPNRLRLRNLMRRMFLNDFARDEVFSLLFFSKKPVDSLKMQLISGLAGATRRALPGDVSNKWIDDNWSVLLDIAQRNDLHLRIRGIACLVLRFHIIPSSQAILELDNIQLPSNDVFNKYTPALPFISDEDLNQLRQEQLSHIDPLNLATGSQLISKQHGKLIMLWVEILARALERDETQSEDVKQGAMVCLGALTVKERDKGIDIQNLTRRLLHSFAHCKFSLEGNARRLHDHLLRTASSAGLQMYFDDRVINKRDNIDTHLYKQLISMLSEDDKDAWVSPNRVLDLQAIADRLARRGVIMRTLTAHAQVNQDFFRNYIQIREENHPVLMETETVVSAKSSRKVPSLEKTEEQVLSVLVPDTEQPRGALADMASNLLPAFVYYPDTRTDLRCLVKLHSKSPQTFDFHSLSLPIETKRTIIKEHLTKQPYLYALARVEVTKDGKLLVDLGVDIPGELEQQQELKSSLPNVNKDVLLIRLETLVLSNFRCNLWRNSEEGVQTINLKKTKIDALQRLGKLKDKGERFKLRAIVRNSVPQKDSEQVRCFLDTGFRLWLKDHSVDPSLLLNAQEAPKKGDTIVIDCVPSQVNFRSEIASEGGRWIRTQVSSEVSPLEGRVIKGTLYSYKGKRRSWKGKVAGLELPIDRTELTGDLRKLFALDEIDDEIATLCFMKVVEHGQQLSVLAVPPRWRTYDLILAVLTHQIHYVTFLAWKEATRQMLFEIGWQDNGIITLNESLGLLALVDEGELFDRSNQPLQGDTLERGMRLYITVEYGRLGIEGHLISGKEAGYVPYLKLSKEIDDLDLRFRQLFKSGSRVQVRVTKPYDRQTKVSLELAEDTKEGFPKPLVRLSNVQDERSFKNVSSGTELEAIVESKWQPEAEDYVLEVTPAKTVQIDINSTPKLEGKDIHRYMSIEAGRIFDKAFGKDINKYFPDGKNYCFVNTLRVFLDPLLSYLLPSPLSGRNSDVSARITNVRRKNIKNALHFEYPGRKRELEYFEKKQKYVYGLVFQTPRDSDSRQIGVYWVEGYRHDREYNYQEKASFECPTGIQLHNGDILCATLDSSQKPIEVELIQENREGTVLYQAVQRQTWISSLEWRKEDTQKYITATLLRISETSEEQWLFAFPPAQLVEIMPSQLSGADRLKDAWPLDKVYFVVKPDEDKQRSENVEVINVETGPLHQAQEQQQRFTLNIEWYNSTKRLFSCTLKFKSKKFEKLTGIPLQVHENQLTSLLPPHLDIDKIKQRLNDAKERDITIDCVLSDYNLEVNVNIDETGNRSFYLHEFTFNPTLGIFTSEDNKPQPKKSAYQKRSLDKALEKNAGRISDAVGKVVTFDKKRGMGGVQLDNYQHSDPLPLQLEEQTWIRYTGELVVKGWKGQFSIIRDEQEHIFASLRRMTPRSLVEWLKLSKKTNPSTVVNDKHLFYYGILTTEELIQCDYSGSSKYANETESQTAEAETLILFEAKPGETFIAKLSQLTFLEQPFDPDTLHYGDRILEFQIIEVPKQNEDEEETSELGLNIRRVELDVCYEIEHFDQQHGIHFGRVSVRGNEVELIELRRDGIRKYHLGRWEIRIETPDEHQLEKLKELSENDYVYLKFVRADEQAGELVFRLATEEEIFQEQNLVYVKSTGKISKFGGSLKLDVEPLSKTHQGEYFIPDTLYSERRWQLLHSPRVSEGIFLAQVSRTGNPTRNEGQKLSLIDIPRRRFGVFMSEPKWQAIVKKQSGKTLNVELSEGLNAELPLKRLDGHEKWGHFEHGDILFLKRQRENYRVTLIDVVRSNLSYLDFKNKRTFLTELWGSQNYRIKKYQRNKTLNCSLIGFPQIEGLGNVSEESINTNDPLPQVIKGLSPDRKRVLLSEGVDPKSVVGKLTFNEQGQPQLHSHDSKEMTLLWDQVTYYEGNATALKKWLTNLNWRNKALTDHSENIQNAELIAQFDPKQNRASLTKQFNRPFPIDHLIEQFTRTKGKQGKRTTVVPSSFVVAQVNSDRLILECAPGRYVELPTTLLLPDQSGNLRQGLTPYWGTLARGDLLSLELNYSREATAEGLFPSIRVLSVRVGNGRHLQVPFVTMLRRCSDGSLKLGPCEGTGIPAEHLEELFYDDQVEDLKKLPSKPKRYSQLRSLYKSHGSRLLLVGHVAHHLEWKNEFRYFVDIGISVPIKGHDKLGDPTYTVHKEDEPLPRDTVRYVRVLEVRFDSDDTIKDFQYKIEEAKTESLTECHIKGEKGQFKRFYDLPQVGDSVMVYCPDETIEDNYRVVGYKKCQVQWDAKIDDPLNLHQIVQRKLLLGKILNQQGTVLWATIEKVDSQSQKLVLSRRVQLEQTKPLHGQVVRARVRGSVSKKRLWIDILGVPYLLSVDELCYGNAPNTLGDKFGYSGGKGKEIEVALTENGLLSSKHVYQLPKANEFEADVSTIIPEGILVTADGCPIFVPASELSWCDLDEELLQYFFPVNTKLQIAKVASGFSHITTTDIRTEIRELRSSNNPIYVTKEWIDETGERSIVRGRSGVLMEVHLQPNDNLEKRFDAYLRHIDTNSRQIILSLEKSPIRIWDMPHINKDYALDCLTSQVINAKLEDLEHLCEPIVERRDKRRGIRDKLRSLGIWFDQFDNNIFTFTEASIISSSILDWVSIQIHLEPSPRNIRLVLETLQKELHDTTWWQLKPLTKEILCQFYEMWQKLCVAFRDNHNADSIDGLTNFAIGYWLLLQENAEKALVHLEKAGEELQNHFDVQLTLARALYLTNQREKATQLLSSLTTRLWNNALHTFYPPLLAPEYMNDDDHKKWNKALTDGNFHKLKSKLEWSVRGKAQQIWIHLAQSVPLETDFDDLVNSFFDELDSAESDKNEIDVRLYVLAAQLSFARGDVITGWQYLDQVQSFHIFHEEVKVALFWQKWLRDEPINTEQSDVDPLLASLVPILRQSRWRLYCEPQYFDECWEIFRKSRHRWILSTPICRALTAPPSDYKGLEQWAEHNDVKHALRYMMDELEVEEPKTDSE